MRQYVHHTFQETGEKHRLIAFNVHTTEVVWQI
jgi:hypothetical protein